MSLKERTTERDSISCDLLVLAMTLRADGRRQKKRLRENVGGLGFRRSCCLLAIFEDELGADWLDARSRLLIVADPDLPEIQ